MRKFWNWARDADTGVRVLTMRGPISDETWFGDEVTPGVFRAELNEGTGPVAAWIDSPGGDVFAAAQIYNMLRDYKDEVNVHIDSLAASAASVIAMAGKTVEISPTGYLMIHNPSMMAWGDSAEMQRAKNMLDEVKEGIINAYEVRTGLSRQQLSDMMDAETWLSAKKAVEMGFADKIMFEDEGKDAVSLSFSRVSVTNSLLSRIKGTPERDTRIILPTMAKAETQPMPQDKETLLAPRDKETAATPEGETQTPPPESETPTSPPDDRVDTSALMHRLNLISH